MKINANYQQLQESYLFSDIAQRVARYAAANPDRKIIKMGIGDVTRPLPPAVIAGLEAGVHDMAQAETFKGYGPEQGYAFLREAIVGYYARRGVALETTEIFVSDGAKSDVGNILDLFDRDNVVLIPDPVYPVYVDTNTMDGRRIRYMDATRENDFLPMPDSAVHADLIYLCSPNNPTGAHYTAAQLQAWVAYANEMDAVILFDAAYEAFVSDPALPRSIFEIPGAETCAIEFCSLSKTAGFTGTRCGYTVVPHKLVRGGAALNKMWLRRQTTKFNGTSYIVQKGAEAVFTEAGIAQTQANIDYYRGNAALMMQTFDRLGIYYTGGKNSPYIWLQCPNGMASWAFFDLLLTEANVVGTPGAGFGRNGEGFFSLSALYDRERTAESM